MQPRPEIIRWIAVAALAAILAVPVNAHGQGTTVTGVVTDREGRALPGASVFINERGQAYGSATNSQGRYAIEDIPSGSYTLIARFVGYVESRKQVTLNGDETTVNFSLRLSTEEIREVIVTAQNRTQNLREVPISATAFTAADLEEIRVNEVQDYADLTPNVTFQNTGRRSTSDITIRGVSNLGGQNNTYGVYIDGLNVTPSSSDIGLNANLVDVSRIEVLRGPQGTHFGRNAIAGAINITTVKPNATPYVEVGGSYASFNTVSGRGVANVPLTDNLYARASGFYEHSDGFLEDLGPAGNTNDRDEWGGRLALRYEPTSALVIDAAFTHSVFGQGYPTILPSGTMNPALVALGFQEPMLEGQGIFPENEDQISTDVEFTSELRSTRLMGRAEYQFDAFSVISLTGVIDNVSESRGDEDNTSMTFVTRDVEETLDSFSQELRVQSDDDGSFTWLIGGNYAEDKTRFDVAGFFGEDTPFAPFVADIPLQFDDGETLRTTESIGVFGEVSVTLWERLDLLAGLRYTHDDVSSEDDSRVFALRLNPDDPGFPGEFIARETDGTISFTDVSPRFAATYHATETINLYGTISRGYKAGGFNENQTQGEPTFDEETLWNYEVGLKGDVLQNRLRFALSGFWMNWNNLQVNSVDISTGTPFFDTQNAAEAESRGLEVQLSAVPVDGLRMGGGLGYLDATFERFPRANVEGEQADLSGGPLPRAPNWTANAFARYETRLTDRLIGFVRGQVAYTGERFEDIAAREEFFVPSYTTWDFSAGVIADRFRLSTYVENAFDSDYFVGIRTSSFSLSGLQVSPRPRVFGVRLTVSIN
ncbi:MAG: TonB-dependent receptor [Bacteroidetes bacterium]|nr:TonB-dependent receptor [Bacteroidota bacterium]